MHCHRYTWRCQSSCTKDILYLVTDTEKWSPTQNAISDKNGEMVTEVFNRWTQCYSTLYQDSEDNSEAGEKLENLAPPDDILYDEVMKAN